MRISSLIATLALIAISLALVSSPSAGSSGIAEHFCQQPVRSHGVSYGVQGSGVRCNFMRFWTARWLGHGGTPRRWSCIDIGDYGKCHRRDHGASFEYYTLD